jgi:5-methylcytosine-specific restriction endonuclease McrA
MAELLGVWNVGLIIKKINAEHIRKINQLWYKENEERIKQHRKNNPDLYREIDKKHYRKRKGTERYIERTRRYRQGKKEYFKKYIREYRQTNKAALLHKSKIYRSGKGRDVYLKSVAREQEKRRKNPALRRRDYLVFKFNNPESYRIKYIRENQRRQARLKNAGGSFSKKELLSLIKVQDGKCYWCDKEMERYSIDHFVPLSKGGSNMIGNIVLCHVSCNSKKRDKSPFAFALEIGKPEKADREKSLGNYPLLM